MIGYSLTWVTLMLIALPACAKSNECTDFGADCGDAVGLLQKTRGNSSNARITNDDALELAAAKEYELLARGLKHARKRANASAASRRASRGNRTSGSGWPIADALASCDGAAVILCGGSGRQGCTTTESVGDLQGLRESVGGTVEGLSYDFIWCDDRNDHHYSSEYPTAGACFDNAHNGFWCDPDSREGGPDDKTTITSFECQENVYGDPYDVYTLKNAGKEGAIKVSIWGYNQGSGGEALMAYCADPSSGCGDCFDGFSSWSDIE